MKIFNRVVLLSLSGMMAAQAANAQNQSQLGLSTTPTWRSWMSTEVEQAWTEGYKGAGTSITLVDDFTSRYRFGGNLGDGVRTLRHGEWTLKEASMIAPSAKLSTHDFYSRRPVALGSGLNVLNLSYGIYGRINRAQNWNRQEKSIIDYATNGQAVIVKSAGNDGVAMMSPNSRGQIDALNLSLRGRQSAIFVGALSSNGTTESPATLASYSNKPGSDPTLQAQFLVVGVRGDSTSLYGTSFAAPVVSGYAAILGSKFTTANPTQITNRLLNTARQDTLQGYTPALYGRGEASIGRALAPVSIN